MKTRNGFVSNSSSSSFVCAVCGAIESGMDASLSDFCMCECESGHVMCNDHKIAESVVTSDNQYGYSESYVECDNCPVCKLHNISDSLLIKYFYKSFGVKEEDFVKQIQKQFKSHSDLLAYLKDV